jgi:hypothetical protein
MQSRLYQGASPEAVATCLELEAANRRLAQIEAELEPGQVKMSLSGSHWRARQPRGVLEGGVWNTEQNREWKGEAVQEINMFASVSMAAGGSVLMMSTSPPDRIVETEVLDAVTQGLH